MTAFGTSHVYLGVAVCHQTWFDGHCYFQGYHYRHDHSATAALLSLLHAVPGGTIAAWLRSPAGRQMAKAW